MDLSKVGRVSELYNELQRLKEAVELIDCTPSYLLEVTIAKDSSCCGAASRSVFWDEVIALIREALKQRQIDVNKELKEI